jgi:hypothetical protein
MSDVIFEPLRFKNLTVKNRIFRSNIAGRLDNYDGSGSPALPQSDFVAQAFKPAWLNAPSIRCRSAGLQACLARQHIRNQMVANLLTPM